MASLHSPIKIARCEVIDQGKTIKQAKNLEIPRCVTNLRYYAGLLLHYHETATETEHPNPSSFSIIRREPVGVVGIICPWNLPLYLLTWKIAPALAMGNCVIAKPSEFTSWTAHMLTELFNIAGLPKGVLNIVFGQGARAGKALVSHPQVRAISFTGGTVTGRSIASLAGSLGKKVSLELGGKNPALVFADCDLEETVNACIRSSFSNQGEICLCCSRIYVEETIFSSFIQKFIEKTKNLTVGDPFDENTDMGALISEEHLRKVLHYIEIARRDGLIAYGGGRITKDNLEKGYFVEPTVIVNAPQDSVLIKDEIFGPVVCISSFKTEDDAIRLANDTDYGLCASVWSGNAKRGQRVARKVNAGVVWVNCWMIRDLATPFGGVKSSGVGREGGTHALEFFSNIKTITTAL